MSKLKHLHEKNKLIHSVITFFLLLIAAQTTHAVITVKLGNQTQYRSYIKITTSGTTNETTVHGFGATGSIDVSSISGINITCSRESDSGDGSPALVHFKKEQLLASLQNASVLKFRVYQAKNGDVRAAYSIDDGSEVPFTDGDPEEHELDKMLNGFALRGTEQKESKEGKSSS